MSKNHLIVIPGHGIWKGLNDGSSSDDWFLESFQIEGNDHLIFIKQIKKAIEIYKNDANSLLMISGGQTKKIAGEISEAQSYYNLIKHLGLLDDQVFIEEFAKDSFENVLFSLCKFKEVTGNYPEIMTFVGFEFKRFRFENLHFEKALNFKNYNYIGFDPVPPYEKESDAYFKYFKDLENAEYNNAIKLFEQDLYGKDAILLSKKRKRNPFNQRHNYLESNPLYKEFFSDQ